MIKLFKKRKIVTIDQIVKLIKDLNIQKRSFLFVEEGSTAGYLAIRNNKAIHISDLIGKEYIIIPDGLLEPLKKALEG